MTEDIRPEIAAAQPDLEVWLCPVHKSLDESSGLRPLDNCVACIRNERDKLRARIKELEMDFTRATEATEEVVKSIEDAFEYHSWTPEMIAKGTAVRKALSAAVAVIIANVPPGPDRTVAIRKIREARMDANSAITHGGKY